MYDNSMNFELKLKTDEFEMQAKNKKPLIIRCKK